MKKIIAIIAVVLVLIGGGGATAYVLTREKTPEQQIVGTWYDSKNDVTIDFKKDKSFEIIQEDTNEKRTGTWKVAGEVLKLDTTSGPDATAEIPKGKITSMYFEFNSHADFYIRESTFEKQ